MIATLTAEVALPCVRRGSRPRLPAALPHLQMDQLPPAEVADEFLAEVQRLGDVRCKQSRMASPGTLALYLPGDRACGPREAFIDGHEFCHIHCPPEYGIHLTLPRILRDELEALGWAEPHPIARLGILTELTTVYAPRDAQEVRFVVDLVRLSCRYAQGQLQGLATQGALDRR